MVTQLERGRIETKSSHSKYSLHHVIDVRPYDEESKDKPGIDSLRSI